MPLPCLSTRRISLFAQSEPWPESFLDCSGIFRAAWCEQSLRSLKRLSARCKQMVKIKNKKKSGWCQVFTRGRRTERLWQSTFGQVCSNVWTKEALPLWFQPHSAGVISCLALTALCGWRVGVSSRLSLIFNSYPSFWLLILPPPLFCKHGLNCITFLQATSKS